MSVEGLLRHIGRIRRAEAERIQRRAQLRYRVGQVFNAIGVLALAGGAVAVLLSM